METFSIEAFVQGVKQSKRGSENGLQAAKRYMQETFDKFSAEEIIEALEAAVPPGASVGEMIVHREDGMTLLYARVAPRFRSGIHNHTVCACIGQLTGEERSVVYERNEDGTVRPVETVSVKAGQVMTLGKDAIHHIENPLNETARSLHLYAGDFSAIMGRRSLWSAQDGQEGPFSFEGLVEQSARAMKADGNERGLSALVEAIPATKPLVDSL